MRRWVLSVVLAVATASPSLGQGLPFHTETALTTAFEQRAIRSFGTWQSRGAMDVFVAPLVILPFAPHQRITTKVVIPLKHARLGLSQGGRFSRTGVGDVVLGAKWAFLVRDGPAGTSRFAVASTISLPTGSAGITDENGVIAPPPSLPMGRGAAAASLAAIGTLVRGRWGVSADLGHERSWSDEGLRSGHLTRYDVALGLRVPGYVATTSTRTVQFYLEWNGSVASSASQDGVLLQNSGGHVAYLAPGVQWVVLRQLLVEASLQIPVIQDHKGTQPDFGLRPSLGGRFLFF